jgi:hypothetical protein
MTGEWGSEAVAVDDVGPRFLLHADDVIRDRLGSERIVSVYADHQWQFPVN